MQTKLTRWLKRRFGKVLLDKEIMQIESKVTDIYAHPSGNGWCCACEYDIAVMRDEIKKAKSKV